MALVQATYKRFRSKSVWYVSSVAWGRRIWSNSKPLDIWMESTVAPFLKELLSGVIRLTSAPRLRKSSYRALASELVRVTIPRALYLL